MKNLTIVILIAAGASLVACGDSAASDAQVVADTWKKAGIEVPPLETVAEHELGEASCLATRPAQIEATLCVYESDDAAAAARPAALAMVGEHTGAALTRGKMLLVVADRKAVDPEGRTINQLTRSFLGK